MATSGQASSRRDQENATSFRVKEGRSAHFGRFGFSVVAQGGATGLFGGHAAKVLTGALWSPLMHVEMRVWSRHDKV